MVWRKETVQDALRRIDWTRNSHGRGRNGSNVEKASYHRLEHQDHHVIDGLLPHIEEVSHLKRSSLKSAAFKPDKLGNHSVGKNWSYRESGGRAVEDICYTSKGPTGVDVVDKAKVIEVVQPDISPNASFDDYELSLTVSEEDFFPEHKEEAMNKLKTVNNENCERVLSDINDNATDLVAGESELSTKRKKELSESSSSVTIGRGLRASRSLIYLAFYRKRLQELELERDQLAQSRNDLEEQVKVAKSSLLKHLTAREEMKVRLDILLVDEDKENYG